MRPRLAAAIGLLACVAALPATARVRNVTDPDAPRAVPEQAGVRVHWDDPERFTDLRYSGNRQEARRGNWVAQLAEHLRDRAGARLPTGERLDVEITDIRRAGSYEPWRGPQLQDVRILRDVYAPRIELRFRRTASDGRVLGEGARTLTDGAYLMGPRGNDGDPLRYEKAMIDRWLRREFAPPRA